VEEVRLAATDDAFRCAILLAQSLDDLASLRGGPTLVGTRTADELLARWLAPDSATTVFVGSFEDAIVGLLAVTTFTRPGAAVPSGQIEWCYVQEEARGVGVGSALMETAVTWCDQKGCVDIDALALPGDRGTKQRLEATGFTARLLVLNRRLD
jgi:GNAT superfamily N-acetyltransferase